MRSKIKIGTRGSKLALWQAHYVEKLLQAGGYSTEIVKIETKGDRILDVSIAKIGSKGVFTEEIEEQLAIGAIDIAVHSAKDMQSDLPQGFELIAFTEREKANDVIISHQRKISLYDQKKPLVIGTSSTRRIAMLKHYYPHVKTVPVRGNLQTRIAKMESGACDALLLAYAGVKRMGYEKMIVEKLPTDTFVPAVGQGSIAIEASTKLNIQIKRSIRKFINHQGTEARLLAERAYLKRLQGGCSIPVFGFAEIDSQTQLIFTGGIISLDGNEIIKEKITGPTNRALDIGEELANKVLSLGGDKILEEIKKHIS